MQILKITKFAQFENLTLPIKDYLVLIGPQASGKSNISKLIYFFKSLRDEFKTYIHAHFGMTKINDPLTSYIKQIRNKFIEFWGQNFDISNLDICYFYDENQSIWINIIPDASNKYIDIKFSDDFLQLFEQIINNNKEYSLLLKPQKTVIDPLLEYQIKKSDLLKKLTEQINNMFAEDQELIFIPAGRAIAALFYNTTDRSKLDPIITNFFDRILLTKSIFNHSLDQIIENREKLTDKIINYPLVNLAKTLINNILKGVYICENDGTQKIYFDLENKRYTEINYSSSGQQESLWILLFIFLLILEETKVFIVIEEPEAHLYPEAQKQIIDLISLLSNINNNQIIITTHSPYILSAISNLIYAQKVGVKHPQEVGEKIHQSLWLDINKIGSYCLDKNVFRDILDQEIHSIELEAIDSASRLINNDYEHLFNLDE